jgi:hypothetical protein
MPRRAAGQPTRARCRTIRTLLVRASSRSMAAATSLGGDSVDQRLPTRRTSPRRSRSCSRASTLSLLIPAARAAIAVENEPGSLRAALLVGDPGAGRAHAPPGAAPAARAAQSWRERVPTGARACVRPADRPRSGHGSCRTRRPAPARPGGRAQTAAIHARSGRRRTAVRRSLFRSGLRYATAFSLHDRTSIAPSQSRFVCEMLGEVCALSIATEWVRLIQSRPREPATCHTPIGTL